MSPRLAKLQLRKEQKSARNYFLARTGLAGRSTRLGLALRARGSSEVAPACPVPALSPKAAAETLAPIGSAGSVSAVSPRNKPRPAHTSLHYSTGTTGSTGSTGSAACTSTILAQGTIVAEQARNMKALASPCMAGIKG